MASVRAEKAFGAIESTVERLTPEESAELAALILDNTDCLGDVIAAFLRTLSATNHNELLARCEDVEERED